MSEASVSEASASEASVSEASAPGKDMSGAIAVGSMQYNAAMGLGLVEEMRRDESIFVVGQGLDSSEWLGAETELVTEFGRQRVLDCDMSEPFEVGLAAGAAVVGMTPVLNIGNSEMALATRSELFCTLGKLRYMQGTDVPMSAVVILPLGGSGGDGPIHSNSEEMSGTQLRGWKVVAPSTPEDAKGLMKAALREPNPVIYHSNKFLGWQWGDVSLDAEHLVDIGKGTIRRHGTDVTLITYGSMVERSQDAAKILSAEGIEAEVLDLRTLLPLDLNLVLWSISKTHRAIVVHEAHSTSGLGAEIVAQIQECAFYELETPVLRVAGRDRSLPQDTQFEPQGLPSVGDIVMMGRQILHI